MRYVERKPPAELERYVKCFWFLSRSYDESNDGEVLWPDGCYEMIFHFGSKYKLDNRPMKTSFLIGSLTRYHFLKANGSVRLFGIRLKPWGLKSLINTDVKVLKDQFVPLTSFLPKCEIEQTEKVLTNSEMDEGIEYLQNIIQKLLSQTNPDEAFIDILTKLYEDPINHDIQTIVSLSNYSQRQFERKGMELTGLTPKKLSKVARFNKVRLKIFFNPDVDLHDCMNEFGYYDYAHFSKEFKECFGLTPKEYKNWMMKKVSFSKKTKKDVVFLQDDMSQS